MWNVGRIEDGVEMMEAAESKEVQERGAFAVGKAAVLRTRGKGREALEIVQTALAARETVGVTSELFREGAIEAIETALAVGDEDAVRSVLAIIDGTPRGKLPTSLLAQSHRAKGRLALLNGDAAESERLLEEACGLFRELAIPFWLGVTSLELGECLWGQGREQEASPLLDEARVNFRAAGRGPLARAGRPPCTGAGDSSLEVRPVHWRSTYSGVGEAPKDVERRAC